jgi:hypothetical protein
MTRRVLPSASFWLLAALLLHLPVAANACTVCMGDPNSKSAGAINAAIFLMLGFVALMLGSFSAFAWYLSRRATTGSVISDAGSIVSADSTEALS